MFNKTESNVIGLLLVKDLALVNPNDNMEIKYVVSFSCVCLCFVSCASC